MELEQVCINGLKDTYAISSIRKEFRKAVNELWKNDPPWQRYQQKLLEDLVVLEQQKERAIDFPQYERLSDSDKLYSIRHPKSKKNVRVIYTIYDQSIILLTVFLEKTDGDYQNAIRTAKKRIRWLNS